MFFQNVTNNRNNNNSTFHQQFALSVSESNGSNKNKNNNNNAIISSSTISVARKRTQTWIEGLAVLNQRNHLVSSDTEDAWDNLMRILPRFTSQQDFQNNNNNENTTNTNSSRLLLSSSSQSFLSEFGFEKNMTRGTENFMILQQPGTTATKSPVLFDPQNKNQEASPLFLDFETQQVSAAHRILKQSQDRLRKDKLGIANLVSNATEELDLGEGLKGTSVARIRAAMHTIESNLSVLRDEERALGDVVGDAEKVLASITKKIMMNNNNTSSTTTTLLTATALDANNNNNNNMINDNQFNTTTTTTANNHQKQYFDSTNLNPHNFSSNSNISNINFDEKLKNFLHRAGGRSLGWPQQEHECFMHILFSGGFEDPAITNATPNLGLRQQQQQQNNINNNHNHRGLADDEQWVAACVVEKLSPLLPHRLPDDIRRHLALQRELEFLEGQRRLEIKSWRDQRDADATLDLGLAAALAREDAALETQNRRETEFERRARQEHLHELVDMWRHKKEAAAATAKAAMAVTQRAVADARTSGRIALQAATKIRNQQLLERRQMLKNAALWSTAARALGASNAPLSPRPFASTMSGDLAGANHANRQHNIPISCSSNMDRAALNYALQERRELALSKARDRRAAMDAMEKQKTEREDRMMLRAELVRTASSPVVGNKDKNNNNNNNIFANRLMQPTKSTSARRQATVEQETTANLASKALCRQTPYFTPRTMSSHRGAAPFSK